MNKAQEYLINAGIGDIVVHGGDSQDPKDWKYLSDVLSEFYLTSNSSKAAKDCGYYTNINCLLKLEDCGKHCPRYSPSV